MRREGRALPDNEKANGIWRIGQLTKACVTDVLPPNKGTEY